MRTSERSSSGRLFEYVGVLVVDAPDKLVDLVFPDEVVQLFGKAQILPVIVEFGSKLESIVLIEMPGEKIDFLAQTCL